MTALPPARTPLLRRLALRLLLAGALGMTALPTGAAASPQDFPRVQATERALFRVHLQSDAIPVPLRRMHTWRIHITDASGQPVSGAVVRVGGGMPQHRHGLPTQPRVTASETPGEYLMSGVRFSMRGRWVLTLRISAEDAPSDVVTFSFVL